MNPPDLVRHALVDGFLPRSSDYGEAAVTPDLTDREAGDRQTQRAEDRNPELPHPYDDSESHHPMSAPVKLDDLGELVGGQVGCQTRQPFKVMIRTERRRTTSRWWLRRASGIRVDGL